MRYPRPLLPGDTIGVTAPSSGVDARLRPRLDHNIAWLRDRGFEVRVGECLNGDRVVSAPKEQRADELMAVLHDPDVRAIVPPWGGELGIDLLDQLDWTELGTLEPTWTVGYSDSCAWLLPLTLLLGWGTIHGTNLMDTAYDVPAGLKHWTEIASGAGPVVQRGHGRFRGEGWDDWATDPTIDTMSLDREGSWSLVGGGGLDVSGRLVGGCIEVVSALAATRFGDVAAFGREYADDGLIVFLEAAEDDSYAIARHLHSLRLAGWFDDATAIVVGRTAAPGHDDLSQHEAVRDALGMLDIPIVLDVECGHVQPFLPLVTGSLARLVIDGDRHEIVQELV
ncbi:MAG: LD-carboxypeptidase [Rhodoferax sp.]|nr:LD-carboxypeptidase [Actinomycetota bacterium]